MCAVSNPTEGKKPGQTGVGTYRLLWSKCNNRATLSDHGCHECLDQHEEPAAPATAPAGASKRKKCWVRLPKDCKTHTVCCRVRNISAKAVHLHAALHDCVMLFTFLFCIFYYIVHWQKKLTYWDKKMHSKPLFAHFCYFLRLQKYNTNIAYHLYSKRQYNWQCHRNEWCLLNKCSLSAFWREKTHTVCDEWQVVSSGKIGLVFKIQLNCFILRV